MLKETDIRPGIVAYFDIDILHSDPGVNQPASPATRNGPFLCYSVLQDQSAWIEITTHPGQGRFEIRRGWRSGGSQTWMTQPQFLNDGATTYRGLSKSFLAAANESGIDRCGTSVNNRRPQVNLVGVEAIREEIERRGGHRLDQEVQS
jgi:hypothetical protein